MPTQVPTQIPTEIPTQIPTETPTVTPEPTTAPTVTPVPTAAPTATIVPTPTAIPTPTVQPTPTLTPTPAATPEPIQTTGPRAVAVDSSEEWVYVADTSNDNIQKFRTNGDFLTQWGSTGTGDDQFDDPVGLTVDTSGSVYVLDSGNNRVQKITPAACLSALGAPKVKVRANSRIRRE